MSMWACRQGIEPGSNGHYLSLTCRDVAPAGAPPRKQGRLERHVIPRFLAAQGAPLRVHIGVLPAESGVSRFLEADQGWAYDKVNNGDRLLRCTSGNQPIA